MDADHLNVVKYSGEEDPNYKEMINELAYSVSQASQKHKPQHKKDCTLTTDERYPKL